jgi:hypothetical protein
VQGSGCVFTTTITVAGNLAFTGSSSNTETYVLVGIAPRSSPASCSWWAPGAAGAGSAATTV